MCSSLCIKKSCCSPAYCQLHKFRGGYSAVICGLGLQDLGDTTWPNDISDTFIKFSKNKIDKK